jgi:putative hydrolase of the HAD superfamily
MMTYTTLFIDLDETVYPYGCGVWEAISKRMEQYMHERLDMPLEEIPAIRRSLYQQYGTTLRGLLATTHVDERDFMDFVHDVPLDQLLRPDPELKAVLQRYPQRKIIFTNADRKHADRVTRHLQIEDCFSSTIDIFDTAPYCKPMPEAFQTALRLAGEQDPGQCVFMDDSLRNLAAARLLGFYTIQVGQPKPGLQHPAAEAHAQIARLSDLPAVLPLLEA